MVSENSNFCKRLYHALIAFEAKSNQNTLFFPNKFPFFTFYSKRGAKLPKKRNFDNILFCSLQKMIFPLDKSNTTIKLGVQKTFLGKKHWELYSKRLYHALIAFEAKSNQNTLFFPTNKFPFFTFYSKRGAKLTKKRNFDNILFPPQKNDFSFQ